MSSSKHSTSKKSNTKRSSTIQSTDTPLEVAWKTFLGAGEIPEVMSSWKDLCAFMDTIPSSPPSYDKLKATVGNVTYQSKQFFTILDRKRFSPQYAVQRDAIAGKFKSNEAVIVVGAGPGGLVSAITMALQGMPVTLIEKRTKFTRNNVLHLWPGVIFFLNSIGIKFFYRAFCSGSFNHIATRSIQTALFKTALIMGVRIITGVAVDGWTKIADPAAASTTSTQSASSTSAPHRRRRSKSRSRSRSRSRSNGSKDGSNTPSGTAADAKKSLWSVQVSPPLPSGEAPLPLTRHIIGADGERSPISKMAGFEQTILRAGKALGITANWRRDHTGAEAKIREMSRSKIYDRPFFEELHDKTGISLENLVYYQDETHYLVFTAVPESLAKSGVIKTASGRAEEICGKSNVDKTKLEEYARDIATFVGLPEDRPWAKNGHGDNDVALFPFSAKHAAKVPSKIVDGGLFVGLVGDALLQPRWPEGTGCNRAVLSGMDIAWCVQIRVLEEDDKEVLREHAACYRFLSDSNAKAARGDYLRWTFEPETRYRKNESSSKDRDIRRTGKAASLSYDLLSLPDMVSWIDPKKGDAGRRDFAATAVKMF